MNKLRAITGIIVCFAALSATCLAATSLAEDAGSTLAAVARTLGAANVQSLHYSGSGSSYLVTPGPVPPGGWPHSVMKSYFHDMNLESATSRMQLVRTEGAPPTEKTITHAIDANSPWDLQYEFWLTPHGFLKGAKSHNATVESRTLFGTTYRAISFTLPGNHKVVGYINDKDLIEKVETWVGENGSVPVEALYRDYSDFNGVNFPSLITEKHAGEIALILVVRDVKPGSGR